MMRGHPAMMGHPMMGMHPGMMGFHPAMIGGHGGIMPGPCGGILIGGMPGPMGMPMMLSSSPPTPRSSSPPSRGLRDLGDERRRQEPPRRAESAASTSAFWPNPRSAGEGGGPASAARPRQRAETSTAGPPSPTAHGAVGELALAAVRGDVPTLPYAELERMCNDFRARDALGQGAYGAVWPGSMRGSRGTTRVAVKVFKSPTSAILAATSSTKSR